MNSFKVNPYFAVILGVITVSTSAIFVKLSSANAEVIAFYRLFFSVLIMIPLFFPKYMKTLKQFNLKVWIYTILAGVFLAFHFILWFESLNYTSVASSTVLVTLQPLFAFVATYFWFKEKYSFKAILCGLIAILGSFVISWGDFQISGTALFGDMLALIACALITAYLLLGQVVRNQISLIPYTFIVYLISTIVLFIYVLISKSAFYPYPVEDWGYFILLAIFPTLLGHSLFNWAVKWVSTSIISMAILFEPVGAALLAYFILKEDLIWTQWLGGITIIASVLIFLRDNYKRKTIPDDGNGF